MNELQTAMEMTPSELDYVSGGERESHHADLAELRILDFHRVLNGIRITNDLNHDSVVVPVNVALAILGGAEVRSVEKKLGIS
jgi:hypothetical protein